MRFDGVDAWEGSGSVEEFERSVPEPWKGRVHFHKQWISSDPSGDPFIPSVIKARARVDDYVLFKLDIDSGDVERGTVDWLLHPAHDEVDFIDEFVWEHHVDSVYMNMHWKAEAQDRDLSIEDSYYYFLRLRRRGVRAHSWV